jgi:hypothetical protein
MDSERFSLKIIFFVRFRMRARNPLANNRGRGMSENTTHFKRKGQ